MGREQNLPKMTSEVGGPVLIQLRALGWKAFGSAAIPGPNKGPAAGVMILCRSHLDVWADPVSQELVPGRVCRYYLRTASYGILSIPATLKIRHRASGTKWSAPRLTAVLLLQLGF